MTLKSHHLRTRALGLLARLAAFVALLTIVALAYLTFERVSGWNQLCIERSKLKAAGLLRPISELVPPPTPEAIANGEKLLTAIGGIRKLSRELPDIVTGPELVRLTRPGIAAPAIFEPTPVLDSPEKETRTWEQLADEIQAARDIFAEAKLILRSTVAVNIDHTSLNSFVDFSSPQHLSTWLRTAVVLKLRVSEPRQAIDDLSDIRKLARFMGSPENFIYRTLELGLWSFAILPLSWEILQYPALADGDLAELESILSRGDFVLGIVRAMEVEVTVAPEIHRKAIDAASRDMVWQFIPEPSGPLGSPIALRLRDTLWPYVWAEGDLARVNSFWRHSILDSRNLLILRDWDTIRKLFPKEESSTSNYNLWRFPFSTVVATTGLLHGMLSSAVNVETRRQLTLAAIALTRYRLAHGTYPDTLAKLVPDYLPGLPHDWFDGQPLKYRPLSDGEFLLYSVNEDGTDDGGDATPTNGKSPNFTNGRDLVWPRVAVPAL